MKNSIPKFFDSHAHLTLKDFDDDRDFIINSLSINDVECVLSVGDDIESSKSALSLANKFQNIYASVGFHPHHASKFNENVITEINQLIDSPKIKAFGEIGLDYHYEFSSKENQREVFSTLLNLGLKLKNIKPFIIHMRKSEDDTLAILKETGMSNFKGIMHCYDSTKDYVKFFLDLGFYISFSGIVTFKKASNIIEALKYVPNNRLLIETDCPYLAPVPKRGKRNEPCFVKFVAEKVALIKNLPIEKVADFTRKNAYDVYNIEKINNT